MTFTFDDLDQRFLALLKQLEDSGTCCRNETVTQIFTKEQWLRAQWFTIQKLT